MRYLIPVIYGCCFLCSCSFFQEAEEEIMKDMPAIIKAEQVIEDVSAK